MGTGPGWQDGLSTLAGFLTQRTVQLHVRLSIYSLATD